MTRWASLGRWRPTVSWRAGSAPGRACGLVVPVIEVPVGTEAGDHAGALVDRHGGVGETSTSLYMMPNLVNLEAAKRATLTMPDHLTKMLPEVVAGDPTATQATGWLGRYLDTLPDPVDPFVSWNTSRETPRTLLGRQP